MNLRTYSLLLAGTVSLAAAGAANAGGFNRGTANLDGLYGSGDIGIYSGVTYVSPGRGYENARGIIVVGGAPQPFSQNDIVFGNDYIVPYASVGGRITGDLSCVGSYTQPFGADTTYSGAITFHIAEQSLATNEYGLTCGYGFDLSKGRLSVIGGAFYETVEYVQARNFQRAFGLPAGFGDSRIDLDSGAFGYRIGLGYEIPEIALKAQLMYRSQTDHDADGRYSNTPFAQLATLTNAAVPGTYSTAEILRYAGAGLRGSTTATASASLPQSVELAVQSGVAEGWLAFGSIKWTDWSVLKQIQLVEGINNRAFSTSRFFFTDGWTITGGVAHRFTEKLAGSVSLTWDQGVSTGWDVLTDTWTIAGGVAYDVSDKFQVRAGGAAIYLSEGQKNKTTSVVDYTATAPAEWGFALSASGSIKF